MNQLDDMLAGLSAEGALEARREFQIDSAKAREKLQKFQLEDPHFYVLELVQAAHLLGATEIRFTIDADEMEVFFDGDALTRLELEELYSAAFAKLTDRRKQAMRHLAIGFNAAQALLPSKIELQVAEDVNSGSLLLVSRPGQERDEITEFPEPIEYQQEDVFAGTEGYILQTAIDEVVETTGITREEIESLGYRIVTTIVPEHQQAAEDAVAQMPEDHADNLRVAAVTVDAATGAITSMYGGPDYLEIQRNAVTQDVAQAGSTFKPFALIGALERGIGLGSEYVANNEMEFEGFDRPVRNFGGVNFGVVDLVKATQDSINTAYVGLNEDVTPQVTMETAIKAGLPEDTLGLDANPANVLGTASPHALDMANAYATIASGGLRTEAYLVQSMTDVAGETVYEREVEPERVFSEDVMADTTYAMQQVVEYGSGTTAKELGRPLAGKTGTSNDNRSAWFVGFSPQIVGAVSLYQVGEDGSVEEITPFGGYSQITGSTVPASIWTWMMGPILEPMEVLEFPARANVGTDNLYTNPTPSPSPTPTPTPTPEETTEEPDPEPTTEEPDPEPTTPPSPTPPPSPAPTVSPPLP